MPGIEVGAIRLRGVSRTFRILHERNLTLKETVLRRRRTRATELWALRDIDLDVAPGESLGVIGQNGSGKSTLLKVLAGIFAPQAGTVEIGGHVAAMLELGAGFHPDFSGRENVYMNGSIHGLSEREIDRRLPEIIEFSELAEFIDMPVKTYSSGMQLRLAFAISSHVNPDVLLLDEALAVGDEAFQRKCYGRIADFRRTGGTLVFVSHDPAAIERICDRVVFIIDGRIVADGPPGDVLAAYHRYLADDVAAPPPPEPDAPLAPVSDSGLGGRDDPRAWGDRQVRITEARLVGPNGPTDRLLGGSPLTIEMVVESDGPVETPNFGIGVHTMEGHPIYGTNTRIDSLPVEVIDGRAVVRFAVEAIPLHEGRFAVTLAVLSQDESVVHHWLDRWLEFSVFSRVTGVGPVDLSGRWTVSFATEGVAALPPPG